jgi:hypothetical protein
VWGFVETLPLVDDHLPRAPLEYLASTKGIDPESFVQAVEERFFGEAEYDSSDTGEKSYRRSEYKAFLGPRPPESERRDFDLSAQDTEEYSETFQKYFGRVVLISRLRETRVLKGFTRLVPPRAGNPVAELSLAQQDWLPAMEVRGEGIFIVLNETRLDSWKSDHANELSERIATLQKRFADLEGPSDAKAWDVGADFLLLHTFAHIMIRQLSFDCGYDASSLRERLYVSDDPAEPMCGVLLYTASGDSEGTLGGLVRQGRPGRLEGTFEAAISNALLCSSDPLCIESDGQGVNGLNMAACHACALLPETSCELSNKLLDRGLLLGTPEVPEIGFFADVIER